MKHELLMRNGGKMRINEIFNSIDGEVNHWGQGKLTTFIRVAGCNLRCKNCDTSYALNKMSGIDLSIEEIISKVKKLGGDKVTITGGEPLMQKRDLILLVNRLSLMTDKISIETNGTFSIIKDLPANWVMDFKTLSTDQYEEIDFSNYQDLITEDWIKFVIFCEEDYIQAITDIDMLRHLKCKAKIAFSPAIGHLEPDKLMEWLQADKEWDITLNIQIHKLFGLK